MIGLNNRARETKFLLLTVIFQVYCPPLPSRHVSKKTCNHALDLCGDLQYGHRRYIQKWLRFEVSSKRTMSSKAKSYRFDHSVSSEYLDVIVLTARSDNYVYYCWYVPPLLFTHLLSKHVHRRQWRHTRKFTSIVKKTNECGVECVWAEKSSARGNGEVWNVLYSDDSFALIMPRKQGSWKRVPRFPWCTVERTTRHRNVQRKFRRVIHSVSVNFSVWVWCTHHVTHLDMCVTSWTPPIVLRVYSQVMRYSWVAAATSTRGHRHRWHLHSNVSESYPWTLWFGQDMSTVNQLALWNLNRKFFVRKQGTHSPKPSQYHPLFKRNTRWIRPRAGIMWCK